MKILLAVLAAATALSAQQPLAFHSVPTPSPADSPDTRLHDVAMLTPTDAWAVGSIRRVVGTASEWYSYALHWDGIGWQPVPTPSPAVGAGKRVVELFSVHAVAANDVWAAGWYYIAFPNNGHIGPQIFLLHWDGKQWTQVTAPIPQFTYMASSSGSRVVDIESFAANDLWLFGYWSGDQFTPQMPMVLQFDGSSFNMHTTPVINTTSYEIADADAVSRSDIWAVGRKLGGFSSITPYVIHWDGSSWRSVTVPTLPLARYRLDAVAAVGPRDVWVTGLELTYTPNQVETPYAVHWDGQTWTRHAMAGVAEELIAFGSTSILAFGTAVQSWDGTSWSMVDPLATRYEATLHAAAHAGGEFLAVGQEVLSSRRTPIVPATLHGGSATAGSALVRLPCAATPLRSSLLAVTTPRIGRQLVIGFDDPARETGLTPGATAAVWLASARPSAGHPCGTPLPFFGPMGGSSELMIDAALAVAAPGVGWTAPGTPALLALTLPGDAALLGVNVYSQGALVEQGGALVLTSGLDLRIGQ